MPYEVSFAKDTKDDYSVLRAQIYRLVDQYCEVSRDLEAQVKHGKNFGINQLQVVEKDLLGYQGLKDHGGPMNLLELGCSQSYASKEFEPAIVETLQGSIKMADS